LGRRADVTMSTTIQHFDNANLSKRWFKVEHWEINN